MMGRFSGVWCALLWASRWGRSTMHVDNDVIRRVLDSLRRWGWEAGAEKLKAEIGSVAMSGSDAGPWLLPLLEARAGALEQLPAQIYESPELRPLVGWGHTGQALVAMRHGDYPRAHQHLDQALASGADGDPILRATCAHYRGAVYHHAGQPDAALVQLHDALELFSTEHFVAGRVLDTLGMVYAATDDYATARELYEAAIRCKERCQDKQGLAVSHGQLGRLALDWGDLREAERHFRMDLDLALRLEDERGV